MHLFPKRTTCAGFASGSSSTACRASCQLVRGVWVSGSMKVHRVGFHTGSLPESV
ncbi:hypothetical protein BZL30_7052 [Mycobacterium kansasii]|uniref:Uncharacterized protein n=1 Tax=Mycobacterium kansasii TaxID=1768 RepID=A0A1V3WQ95_MYCKA|nr:hypothetical protein BZL30_7052 [Mycobacterium kansasii]